MNIHSDSQKMIDETFSMYKDGGKCPSTLYGQTIIHLYPRNDTLDPQGFLNGYYQNLFFDMVIFNIHKNKKIRYRFSGKKDAIFTHNVNITNLSIFNGAFCVNIEGTINFLDDQAPTLEGLG